MAVLVGAAGLATIDSRMLPAALGGLGVVAAVLLVIPVLPVTLAGLVGAAVWVFVAGTILWRQPRAADA